MGTISATDPIILDNTNPDIVKGFYKWPFNITRVFYTRTEGNRVNDPDYLLSGLMSRAHLSGYVYELLEKLAFVGVMATATLIQKESSNTKDDTSYRINMDLLDGRRYRCKSECPAEKCREFEKDIAELFLSRARDDCDKGKLKDEIIGVCKKFKNKCNECQEKTDACNFDSCNCGLEAGADPDEDRVTFIEHITDADNRLIGYAYNCPLTKLGCVAVPIAVMHKFTAVLIIGQFADQDIKPQLDKKYGDVPIFSEETKTIVFEHIMHLKGQIRERLDIYEKSLSVVVQRLIRERFANLDGKKDENLNVAYEHVRGAIFPLLEKAYSLKNIEIYYRALTEGMRANGVEYTRNCLPKGKMPVDEQYAQRREEGDGKSRNSELITLGNSRYALRYFRNAEDYSVMEIRFDIDMLTDYRREVIRKLLEPIASELYSQFIDRIRVEEAKRHYDSLRFLLHELGTQQASGIANAYKLKTMNRRFVKGFCKSKLVVPSDITSFDEYSERFDQVLDDNESVYRRISSIALSAKPANETGIILNPDYFNIYTDIFNPLAANYRIILKDKGMRIMRKRNWQDQPSRIFGDSQYLQMAINNLFSNAYKYGYMGTNIYYSCTLEADPETNVEAYVIRIENYGELIPESEWTNVFKDEYRNHRGAQRGMGFGLFFVKMIAELHGGRVIVEESTKLSDYSLPFLWTMADNISFNKNPNITLEAITKEIEKWEDRIDLLDTIVCDKQVVTASGLGKVKPASLFSKFGCQPTAKTVFTIYLPTGR